MKKHKRTFWFICTLLGEHKYKQNCKSGRGCQQDCKVCDERRIHVKDLKTKIEVSECQKIR